MKVALDVVGALIIGLVIPLGTCCSTLMLKVYKLMS